MQLSEFDFIVQKKSSENFMAVQNFALPYSGKLKKTRLFELLLILMNFRVFKNPRSWE